MSYHNLSNEEIVFLYYAAKNVTDQYEDAYNSRQLNQNVATESGIMKLETFLPKEILEELLQSDHYLIMKSIKSKLQPIYELIIEVEPEIDRKMRTIFFIKKN